MTVVKLFPGHGAEDPDPLVAAIEKRQDALSDGLQDRLNRAGLKHEAACPVMLFVFGMAHELAPLQWSVSARVSLKTDLDSKAVYPSWDSGEYRASFKYATEAQTEMERALTERVERFLEYFGVQPAHE